MGSGCEDEGSVLSECRQSLGVLCTLGRCQMEEDLGCLLLFVPFMPLVPFAPLVWLLMWVSFVCASLFSIGGHMLEGGSAAYCRGGGCDFKCCGEKRGLA